MTQSFAERWDALGRGESLPTPDVSISAKQRHHYEPLAAAADDFVHWAQNPSERIYLGFPDIDSQMRGIAPSEMCLINGYSHSGKTMFLLQILLANADKSVIYFCPDEPRTLTLIKLACLLHGVDAGVLEERVANNDPSAIQLLRSTANEHFPNLAVFDQMMTLNEMEQALDEIRDMWGQPHLMVFDYLELLNGGGEDVPSKANTLKAFGKRHNIPLLVLHQSSRTAGADGKKMTISSGAYGGEQQATHIIGVRRKRFEIEAAIREIEERLDTAKNAERLLERLDALRYDLRIHQNTVTVNLVKCKRPASSLLDDIDFEIELGTGRLTRLPSGDKPWLTVDTVPDMPVGEQLNIDDLLLDDEIWI
jgi:KaiC/GvpD/RAD55 family RecA-like ATPase